MTFKHPIWRSIAIAASGLNLVGVGFAAGAAEPWHAGIHAGLALVFGLWAQRLQRGAGSSHGPLRVEELEAEMSSFRAELTEVQERLDFTERMLAQGAETRRLDPDRKPGDL